MEFTEFNSLLQKHVANMTKDISHLFIVDVDKDMLWNTYLDSFPEGTNKIFRKQREFDCSCCRHFIKSFGNVVSIVDSKILTIWDFEVSDFKYQPVVHALARFVKSKPITDLYVTKTSRIGTEESHEYNKEEHTKVITWNHFFVELNSRFVSHSSLSEASIMGTYRDSRNVFKRSLDELTEDSVQTVLELISQNSLYKGEEWKAVLEQFLSIQSAYNMLPKNQKDNYCWKKSGEVGGATAKIRNHSIGTLLIDISEGVDLDVAVRKYEAIVAPTNYKRPKAIFTQKMLEDAKKALQEEGLLDSLERRYATIDDITINNILFANKNVIKKMKKTDVFGELEKGIAVNSKSFSKTEEVNIGDFVKDILPNISSMEVLLENRHSSNMMSLIAPKVKDSSTLFKWDNGFSWAYKGNITDSMKERVKAAGGNVDGVLRFSLQWNDNGDNQNDFDAHCYEPTNGSHIYFTNKGHQQLSSGMLDVDIIHPNIDQVAVENIIYTSLNKMPEGIYKFVVNNYCHRGGTSGFTAEIEFDGQIFSYAYDRELKYKEDVKVAMVQYNRKDGFKIIDSLPSSVSSRDIWGLKSNQFYPVSVAMYSPNYWDEQDGIGNRHYFFMLDGCKNDESPSGFFNEYIKEDFMKHKRVFEALSGKMRVEDCGKQLSGVGFSSTQRNSVVCKVTGKFDRTIKITF
jgi:hypothetical protein